MKYALVFSFCLLSFSNVSLYYKNKLLKSDLNTKDSTILSQSKSIEVFKKKQNDALKEIENKQQELLKSELERKKYEKEFNQKASKEYHQWRSYNLPYDIIHRMRNRD